MTPGVVRVESKTELLDETTEPVLEHDWKSRHVPSNLVTTANGPDQEDANQVAETPNRLQKSAEGMTEAQAWKGQQIAKGWRKLVAALHRNKGGA
jgi:hypothetical protein